MIENLIFQFFSFFALIIGIYELLGVTTSEITRKKFATMNDLNFFERIQYIPAVITKERGWLYIIVAIISLFIVLKDLIPIPEFCGKHRLFIVVLTPLLLALFSLKKHTDDIKKLKDPTIYDEFIFGKIGVTSNLLMFDLLETLIILISVGSLTEFMGKTLFKSY